LLRDCRDFLSADASDGRYGEVCWRLAGHSGEHLFGSTAAQYRGGAEAMLECRELMERTLEDAPGLPLSHCTPAELDKWTDAITTVLMNLGLARVALDTVAPAAVAREPQTELAEAIAWAKAERHSWLPHGETNGHKHLGTLIAAAQASQPADKRDADG
jgi:hypothetical protein